MSNANTKILIAIGASICTIAILGSYFYHRKNESGVVSEPISNLPEIIPVKPIRPINVLIGDNESDHSDPDLKHYEWANLLEGETVAISHKIFSSSIVRFYMTINVRGKMVTVGGVIEGDLKLLSAMVVGKVIDALLTLTELEDEEEQFIEERLPTLIDV